MKTGELKEFIKVHEQENDINKVEIHLTDEQIKAINYLAKDQEVSFENMAMVLIQYQMQAIEVQHKSERKKWN